MRISRQDLRLAVRSFARHRGFTVVAVLSLALAIALNTTMYSVIDAMVSPTLNMRRPDKLFWLTIWGDVRRKVSTAERSEMLRSGMHTYEALSYYRIGGTVIVEHGREFDRVTTGVVSPNFFHVVGASPVSGRLFMNSDFGSPSEPVLVGEHLQATLFPNGESAVGKSIDIDGVKHPVIGVIGKGSVLPGGYGEYRHVEDLWMLLPGTTPLEKLPINVVRLRDDATVEQAERELSVLARRLALAAGELPKETRFQISSATEPQFSFNYFHYALIGAVVAVLLVACANLANLQLARGISRSRELALRTALGATRADLVAQLVLESSLLAAAGLVVGLLLTLWGTSGLAALIPPSVADYIIAPQISWRVMAFAVGAGVACVMFVGLFPAIRISRVDPNQMLKAGAGTGATKRDRQQYGIMVAAEIGLSLALLSGAALVVRTAMYYEGSRLSVDARQLVVGNLGYRPPRGVTTTVAGMLNAVESRVRALPDVGDVTASWYGGVAARAVTVADPDGSTREVPAPMFGYAIVSSAYLRTKRIPMLEGRNFADGVSGAAEVIVDKLTATFLWPGVSPVGRLIKLGADTTHEPWIRVIGVVGNEPDPYQRTRAAPPQEKASRLGRIYLRPSDRDTVTPNRRNGLVGVGVLVRANTEPARIPGTLVSHFVKDPEFTLRFAETLEESTGFVRLRQRHSFVASVFSVFAALAIGLAALGIHGVISHSVAERKRELGVRIALGASSRNILGAVLREGNAIALAGVAVGLLCTKYSAGWLRAFIFEYDEYDAPLFAVMAIVLFAVVVLSALWPALRATRIDPVESLRSE